MRIAVTSQNRKTVTGHAGKCRKFWIFEVDDCEVLDKQLLELPIEQSFHESQADRPHPLDAINVLITAGMGSGLQQRLKRKGIMAVATAEPDPDQAVAAWLNGTLRELPPGAHHQGGHGHHHWHPRSRFHPIGKPPCQILHPASSYSAPASPPSPPCADCASARPAPASPWSPPRPSSSTCPA